MFKQSSEEEKIRMPFLNCSEQLGLQTMQFEYLGRDDERAEIMKNYKFLIEVLEMRKKIRLPERKFQDPGVPKFLQHPDDVREESIKNHKHRMEMLELNYQQERAEIIAKHNHMIKLQELQKQLEEQTTKFQDPGVPKFRWLD